MSKITIRKDIDFKETLINLDFRFIEQLLTKRVNPRLTLCQRFTVRVILYKFPRI